jgi:hypothetical protein
MTKISNSKLLRVVNNDMAVSVTEISKLEFVWNLLLEFWNFPEIAQTSLHKGAPA